MGLTKDLGSIPRAITVSGSNNNVGVSKEIPNAKLDVNGNTIITGSLNVTQGITGSLFGTATTASFVNLSGLGGFVQGGNSFGAQALIGTNDNQSLALETNGTVRMFVSSSGNVGIGTTTPASALEVRSNSVHPISWGGIDFFNNRYGVLTWDINRAILQSETGYAIGFNTNGANERMRITSGGDIGIGTTNPTRILDINGQSISNGHQVRSTSDGSTLVGAFINRSNWTGGTLNNDLAIGSYAGNLTFFTNNSTTERMRITSVGNVGIGTTSPTSITNYVIQTLNGAGGSFTEWQENGTNTFRVGSDIGLGGFVYTQGATGIRFGTNGAERMRISATGIITTPSQPAFRAYNSTNNIWTLAGNATFVFNTTEYNIGNCYNTSNGRFTAPVAGVYQFNFYTIILGAYTNGAVSLRRNDGAPTSGFNVHFSPSTGGAWSNVVYTTSIYLNAGDYVNMINGSTSVDYHGDDWSSFSGYLVG